MGVTSLVTALVIGLVIGASGWSLLPDDRSRAVWPAVVVGVAAAVLGTVVARSVGVARSPGINWLEMTFQLSSAAAGVAALARVTRSRDTNSTRTT
jgi:uncharacterized membrane protein YeaQ/YmgE (transglycosylase-associated protein family)